jgi:S-DNA-T family DNA segregation ATPase FtsK/SpoIIIE
VGETTDGLVTANLRNIHHLLIAGATGGGKSVFFKQTLVGLLRSSRFLQLYLIDLKRGVEFKPFSTLANVEVAKDEASALSVLHSVVAEMERRFKLLEERGFNEIHPERDKLDRIVVAIDEASVLFTVGKSSKAAKETALSAREMTDQIAKLGRAAGIHLILATQKVVKETIDTRVQTNINAKMCFRVNTIASSMTVIGNKKAAELPDIKGRGIWSLGSNDLTVQVPRLTDDEITEEIGLLTEKFNGEASPLQQPMLQIMSPKKARSTKLVMSDSASDNSSNSEVQHVD